MLLGRQNELDEVVPAQRGFAVIGTANIRDRGANDMSAALKRRFNFVTIPVISSLPKGTKVGTFDVGGSIKEILAGRMLFAVDQQQYLQGYLPVVFAYLYKSNLNTVGNGQPVLTGPGIINKANAAKVAALAKQGTR